MGITSQRFETPFEGLPAANETPAVKQSMSFHERRELLLNFATYHFNNHVHWSEFYAAVYESELVRLFPTDDERQYLFPLETWAKIQKMFFELLTNRQQHNGPHPSVITVRLPKAIHEKLKDQAHERRCSLNALCVLKLIDQD